MGDPKRAHEGSVPFWTHQLVEMLLAALLVLEGARTEQHTAVLVGLGGALLVLSIASDGPLGAWPWIPRRAHRWLDFGFAAAFAVSPIVLSLDGVLAIVVIEAVAAGLVWLAFQTNWTSRPRERARRARATSAPADPGPGPASPLSPGSAPPSPRDPLPRRAGSAVGRAGAEGPRRLGRAVGRVRAKGRRPPRPPAT